MRIDHFEVTFGHWQINRLANRAARMMQARMHIGQLYQIAEVFHRRIAALIIKITHKGRAIDRCKNRIHSANFN